MRWRVPLGACEMRCWPAGGLAGIVGGGWLLFRTGELLAQLYSAWFGVAQSGDRQQTIRLDMALCHDHHITIRLSSHIASPSAIESAAAMVPELTDQTVVAPRTDGAGGGLHRRFSWPLATRPSQPVESSHLLG